jgi:hypothetical protein
MKTKTIEHTQGEWTVNHIKTEEGRKKGTHEHYFQVVTEAQDHNNKIGQANANLIAAAPEMLQALEYVLSWSEGNIISLDTKKIKAAIEKAKW